MNDTIEAARKFDELMGPAMLWGVNHWQLVLACVVILGLALGLAQRAQKIGDRQALARDIARYR